MHIIAAGGAPTFEEPEPAVAVKTKTMMGRGPDEQGKEGIPHGADHLDRLPPKASTLLFSFLPTSGLLSLRCCSKAHYARFHAVSHWDEVSQRLVVELHASRFHLATASDIVGPAGGDGEEGPDGMDIVPPPPPPKRLVARPLVVGHRGASGHRVGNSLASFHHAVALGADMIELDVCLDSSGAVVVHHDSYFKATGQLLSTLTLPEIKRLAPEVEPLTVVLRELQASGVSLYLDIKTGKVVPPLMRVLHDAIQSGGWQPSRLLIASFNQHDIGIEVNAHRLAFPHTLGSVQTCIIVDGVPISLAKHYTQLGVSWCSIGDGCVLPSFVEDAHSRGIGVMVWTVNNAAMMQKYLALGVDAVVTDFPERAVAVVRAEAAAAACEQPPAPVGTAASSPAPQGSPKRPRGGGGSGGSPGPLLPYPAALHQPRKRLVQALRQAWPLLRALEGRRPHASHEPPTPTATQAMRRRQQFLAFTDGQGNGNGDAAASSCCAESDSSSSSTSSCAPPPRSVITVCGGLLAHLKAAAQAAEEVATAVLQPRLMPRRLQRQRGAGTAVEAEGDARPQTPPRAEEGSGGEKGSSSSSTVPTACGLTASVVGSSSTSDRVGGREKEEEEEEEEEEHKHGAPFLPFERKWAAQTASYS